MNSSETNVLISEQCGSENRVVKYTKKGRNDIVEIKSVNTAKRICYSIGGFFREVLLPYGYPDSVSQDYLQYQIYDTLQAFCSTITGAFTTRAVLKGVGVGNASATSVSAAVTWVMKEGTGMIGRILFAWWKGNGLDTDCKKWRFFADVLNDTAMTIELFLPMFRNYSMHVLCVTSVMKSVVGIAGGATRASITHHQAISDNMAEISAKDGSQETVVNLLGSVISIFLLQYVTDVRYEWLLIFTLMAIHLYANYLAVKSLVFKNLNNQRMALVLKSYFRIGTVSNPRKVNDEESVFLGVGLKVRNICGFNIAVGQSIKNGLMRYKAADFVQLTTVYEDRPYILLVNFEKKTIYVSLEKGVDAEDVIAAYFHATCLGVATCIYNVIEVDLYSKRQLHHPTPITRLFTFMKSYETHVDDFRNIPHNYLTDFNEFVKQEYSMFFTALNVNGWNLMSHSLEMGEWRSDWKLQRKNA